MRHLCRFPYVNASCGIGRFRRRRFKRFGASPLTQAFMLVYSSLRAAFNAVLGKLFNIQISTCSIGCSFRSYFSSVGAVAFGCLRFVGGQIDWRDLRNCREAMRRYRDCNRPATEDWGRISTFDIRSMGIAKRVDVFTFPAGIEPTFKV